MADYDNLTVGQLVETAAHINGWQKLRRLMAGGARLHDLDDGDEVSMASGTYLGNGSATQAITGVGFQPRLVLIWRQPSAGIGFIAIKSSQDSSTNALVISSQAGGGLELSTSLYHADAIRSLDSDGFTVGDTTGLSLNFTNASSTSYTWIAWR